MKIKDSKTNPAPFTSRDVNAAYQGADPTGIFRHLENLDVHLTNRIRGVHIYIYGMKYGFYMGHTV